MVHEEHIEIFTGNRAEFTILYPLIEALAQHYHVHLLVSGAHLLDVWGTNSEVTDKVSSSRIKSNISVQFLGIEASIDDRHAFPSLIPSISQAYLDYKKTVPYDIRFCLVLGDRIETFAYALTAFYFRNILVHVSGGDVTMYPVFDSNIRHALTKISHLHLVSNEKSLEVVKSLGEESWRVLNIGMPSLDSIKSIHLSSRETLIEKFKLRGPEVIITTYHPDQFAGDAENLKNFRMLIDALKKVQIDVILTYPNNDPGHEALIQVIEQEVSSCPHIRIIKNLGLNNYISCLAHLKPVLVGNSSSLVTESSFFKIPALLLGKRQYGRFHGKNVTEWVQFTEEDIPVWIQESFANYDSLQVSDAYMTSQYLYGNGKGSVKGAMFLKSIFAQHSKEMILVKKLAFADTLCHS